MVKTMGPMARQTIEAAIACGDPETRPAHISAPTATAIIHRRVVIRGSCVVLTENLVSSSPVALFCRAKAYL